MAVKHHAGYVRIILVDDKERWTLRLRHSAVEFSVLTCYCPLWGSFLGIYIEFFEGVSIVGAL